MYHNRQSGGQPIKAYASRENAASEAKRLNEVKVAKTNWVDGDGATIRDFYEVLELEVAEERMTYATARETIAKAREAAFSVARSEFNAAGAQLFETYPELESVMFRQYTDYFNDGETCNFHVHRDYPYINGDSLDDIDHDDGRNYRQVQVREPSANWPMIKAVKDFLALFDSEDMEAMFGDHKEITVQRTPKGISVSVEDYTSHD